MGGYAPTLVRMSPGKVAYMSFECLSLDEAVCELGVHLRHVNAAHGERLARVNLAHLLT